MEAFKFLGEICSLGKHRISITQANIVDPDR